MREVLVAGFIFLVVGCVLLATGLVAIAITPEGFGFFARPQEVSENGRYQALRVIGFVVSMGGVIVTPAGVFIIIKEGVRWFKSR